MMVTGCPTASSAVKPKISLAAAFQLEMMPLRSSERIASSEDSTMAASLDCASSAFFRSVMSRITLSTTRPSAVSMGLSMMSTGNSGPSFRRP